MSRAIQARHLLVTAAVLLGGCDDLVGIWDSRPPSYVEREGLSYQVIVTESRYTYDAFEYRVRVTNTSHHTIEQWLPGGMVSPRVYRDGQWNRPVWELCRNRCGDYGGGTWLRLRRGEAVEGWGGLVYARDFAEYSRRGPYHLAVLIDTGHDRFEVLGLPELYVR